MADSVGMLLSPAKPDAVPGFLFVTLQRHYPSPTPSARGGKGVEEYQLDIAQHNLVGIGLFPSLLLSLYLALSSFRRFGPVC